MPQSPPRAGARRSRPSRPARPDAAMTRSASRVAPSTRTPLARPWSVHTCVDVPGAQPHPRLALGGGAQHAFEGQSAAPDPHQLRTRRTRPEP